MNMDRSVVRVINSHHQTFITMIIHSRLGQREFEVTQLADIYTVFYSRLRGTGSTCDCCCHDLIVSRPVPSGKRWSGSLLTIQ